MPNTPNHLAILFADIAGSTRMYDSLGNAAAKALIDQGLSLLGDQVRHHGGEVIKNIGDEILCAFPTADQAAAAARDMHQALNNASTPEPLVAYVGFHWGDVIREDGDVFGDAVNVAARLVALKRPRQTLTTGTTLEELEPALKTSARFIDRMQLRGKPDPFEIYELVWEAANLTFVGTVQNPLIPDRPPAAGHLELTVQGRTHRVDVRNSRVSLGRLDHNDIVVSSPCTSRTHARIECRGGKFVLIDQSSNGTFIHGPQGEPIHVVRNEAPLTGEGRIGLGSSADDPVVEPVAFRIVSGAGS